MIGDASGMDRQQGFLAVERRELGQRRMQAEHRVERDRAAFASRRRNGDASARRIKRGIAVGRHGGETVHAAALDDHDEAFVDGRSRERDAWQGGQRDAETGALQRVLQKAPTVDVMHGHLRMNSGDVSNSVTACAGLSARPMAVRVSADRRRAEH